jgi:hypothetical protein
MQDLGTTNEYGAERGAERSGLSRQSGMGNISSTLAWKEDKDGGIWLWIQSARVRSPLLNIPCTADLVRMLNIKAVNISTN